MRKSIISTFNREIKELNRNINLIINININKQTLLWINALLHLPVDFGL